MNNVETRRAADAYVRLTQSYVGKGQFWGYAVQRNPLLDGRWRNEGVRERAAPAVEDGR